MIFSIIIPIYKVEKYLRECIESVLDQTFTDFELILVDDGSPDSCPQICDEYSAADSRIKVIHKKNGGLVSARNTGLKAASGDYICYLDGDDFLEKHTLEKVCEKAVRPYNADAVIFNMVKRFIDHEESCPFFLEEGFYDKGALKNNILPYMMWDRRMPFYKGMVFPSAGGKIFRRELILEHCCKDERITMGEDNAYIFETLFFADSLYVIHEDLYIYNQLNQGSFIHSYDENRFYNNRLLIDYMQEHFYGLSKETDEQFNAFKAYWLMMAVFHEVKCKKKIKYSAKHIKEGILKYHSADGIDTRGLPLSAKAYVFMLRKNLFFLTLLMTWLAQLARNIIRR